MKAMLFAVLLASAPAFATPGPVVVKSSGSGFVMPQYSYGESCEVYADKVVVTKTFGIGVQLVDERAITLKGDLDALVDAATAEAAVSTPNGLCDGPATGTYAKKPSAAEGSDGTVLFSTGGCGSPSITRNGPASQALRAIADTYCPLTYKSGIEQSR